MRVRSRAGVCLAVILASIGLLAAPPLVQIDNPSPAADAAFGSGLDGIGDVNGDGLADLIAGAPGSSKAFFISGADHTVIRTLTDPEGKTGLNFGFVAIGAGDVTGDGIEDVAVGAPGPTGLFVPLPCDPSLGDVCPPADWGRVFLFNGGTGALIRKIVPTTPSFLKFGLALANLGDINGDSVPDLAVGSPVLQNFWGEVYAFSGASGAQVWMSKEPGARQPIASFGEFLAPLADVTGDGKRDLIVAAPFFDNDPDPSASVITGKVFVVSGATGAIVREHLSATPADNGFYGGTVSAIGDQNGDGSEDYLIADRGRGVVDLRRGADGTVIRSITSPAGASGIYLFARAGDRNGDGLDDFWLGAPLAGAAYLLDGLGTVLLQAPDPGTPASGIGGFGGQLAALADINGDSKPEVLIAKSGQAVSGFAGAGTVYLLTSNRPPDANAGPDQSVSAGADCMGHVTLDGSASSDPDGNTLSYTWSGSFGTATGVSPQITLPLGVHVVTLTVTDGNGGSDTDTVTITVADTSGPTITSVSATPHTLWPANHKMVPVTTTVIAVDNCTGATCRVVGVVSNEPDNGTGDGDAAPDWRITGDLTVDLRAERAGSGTGRVYGVVVECRDGNGNASSVTVTVSVPLAIGK